MTSLPYLRFTEHDTKIGAVLTVSINSFLIYFTVFHIKNIRGGYKTLIVALANLEIVFALLEFIVQPFIHSFNSSYAYFTVDPVYGASKLLKFAAISLYSCIYSMLISLIAVQFFYRHCAIKGSDPKTMKLLERWWWAYCVFWSSTWIAGYQLSAADELSKDYLREVMVKEYESDVEDVPGFFIVIYNPKTKSFNLNSLICVATLCTILLVQYTVIIISGLKIHRKMAEVSQNVSGKTLKIQKQLFKTLIFQTLTPFIFHHIPAFFFIVTPFMDLKFSFPSGVVVCFYSLFPPVDSLILMYMVTEFRVVIYTRCKVHLVKVVQWIDKFTEKETAPTTIQDDN